MTTHRFRSPVTRATAFLNLVLLGLTCWALVRQYPPPEGPSVLVFGLLMLTVPVLTLIVLLDDRRHRLQQHAPRA